MQGVSSPAHAISPLLCGSSNTGLSTPLALPTTAEALTYVAGQPYCFVG